MRPIPTMPSRLPVMRWPSIQVGDQPVQSSAGMTRAPSGRRRATAMISAMVMSAVSSVRTPGVLVTVMPRASAACTSMLSTPLPKFAISLRFGPACASTEASISSVTVGTSTSASLTASARSAGDIGLSSRLSRVSNSSRIRVSTTSGRRRVTTTTGLLLHRLVGVPTLDPPIEGPEPSRSLNPRSAIGRRWSRNLRPAPSLSSRGSAYRQSDAREPCARRVLAIALLGDQLSSPRSARSRSRRGGRPRHGPAGAPLREPEDRPGEPARRPLEGQPHAPGSSSAPACRSKSSRNTRPGAASAIRRAPKAGCCTPCSPAGAPPW